MNENPVWNVELHAHTSVSPCATVSPERFAQLSRARGLDAVAVTDHDRIDAAQHLQRVAPFLVIVGEEITSADGDIIGYFLKHAIPPGLSAAQTIERIREQGGLVSIPHPCDTFRTHRMRGEILEMILPQIDFLETWNARNVLASANQAAERVALQHHLPQIAASDSHTRFEVGKSYMRLPAFSSPAELLSSVKAGSCVRGKSPVWVHGITKLKKTLLSVFGKL